MLFRVPRNRLKQSRREGKHAATNTRQYLRICFKQTYDFFGTISRRQTFEILHYFGSLTPEPTLRKHSSIQYTSELHTRVPCIEKTPTNRSLISLDGTEWMRRIATVDEIRRISKHPPLRASETTGLYHAVDNCSSSLAALRSTMPEGSPCIGKKRTRCQSFY